MTPGTRGSLIPVSEQSRIGWGIDAHRFGGGGPLVLCGVVVDEAAGVIATSDGDVAVHALADALLGAAALGDLGMHFPSSDAEWAGASSMMILDRVVSLCSDAGFALGSVDVTIVAESVRIAPHREDMRRRLAGTLGTAVGAVSVKATTTDGLGFAGRNEGIVALAVATLHPVA